MQKSIILDILNGATDREILYLQKYRKQEYTVNQKSQEFINSLTGEQRKLFMQYDLESCTNFSNELDFYVVEAFKIAFKLALECVSE